MRKRNSLLLVFLVGLFCLISFDSLLAQDLGVPDTLYVERIPKVLPNSQVVLNFCIVNDESLGAFTVPLLFPDTLTYYDITCDSISWIGTRSADATYKSDASSRATDIVNAKNRVTSWAIWFSGQLNPGNVATGPAGKIYFHTGVNWDSTVSVSIDTTTVPITGVTLEFVELFSGKGFTPIFPFKGALEVRQIDAPAKPTVFSLSQNYPNPFNPKTLIRFSLPRDSWVKMEVYNVLGQKVKTLVDEKLAAGIKEVEWNGKDDKGNSVSSGIYFYKIKADDFSDVKKMVMLK